MGSSCSVIPDVPPTREVSMARAAAQSRNNGLNNNGNKQSASTDRAGAGTNGTVRGALFDKRLDLVGNGKQHVQNPLEHNKRSGTTEQPQNTMETTPLFEVTIPSERTRRPRSTRPFADLLGKSLLLRYHQDRVVMFTRLRGSCVTPEGWTIPSIRDRLLTRRNEINADRYEGAGHLYFVAPERPLPVPLSVIPAFDVQGASHMMLGVLTASGKEVTQEILQTELRRQLASARLSLKNDIIQMSSCIGEVDLDGATAACQRLLSTCKRFSLYKLLAIGLQMFLCMNDILVIECIGTTFEEAVRAYLGTDHSAEATTGNANKDIPDLTTVLELYTLLVGGYPPTVQHNQNDESTATKVSLHGISVGIKGSSAPPSNEHQQPGGGGEGIGLVDMPPAEMPVVIAGDDSRTGFQPTLFTPYNYSGSETGIVLTRSITARGGQSSASCASTATPLRQLANESGATTVTGGHISTGSFLQFQSFQMPRVLASDGEREVQLQLIEQVNVMLEVQQMLWDTLDYLMRVARFHTDQEWRV